MMAKKIISTLAAFSIMASFCGAISVSAAPTDSTPWQIEYVEVADSATRRIDVYYSDDYAEVGTLGYDFKLSYPSASVASVSMSNFDGSAAIFTDKSAEGFCKATTALADAVKVSGRKVLTIELTLAAETEDFEVCIASEALFVSGDEEEIEQGDTNAKITVTGNKVVEPEPETIAATSVGMFTEWEDADAQAFKANLTAAQSAKTVTWKVTGAGKEKTAAANLGTVTGIDMVIGLIVTNAVDGLTATVVVE